MNYAEIENAVCVNIIEAEPDFAAEIGAVELPYGFGKGDYYQDGKWTKKEIPTPEPVTEPISNDQLHQENIKLAEAIAQLYESMVK